MKFFRRYPSLSLVLAANVLWTIISAISPALGRSLWRGEQTPVERGEVVLLLVYIGAWVWITRRLKRPGARRLPWVLAALMAFQLFIILGEEVDWLHLFWPYRNLRVMLDLFLPQVLDSLIAGGYLILFLFVPLLPIGRVQRWLERAAPVRARREDAWAALAIPLCWGPVFLLVGDQTLGELHQVGVYAIVGVITVRIVRELRAK